ncbi:MAG: outer membrane beta-barrel protein [Chitinophagales bacterium]|nr:PorT family protein [Chitinophagales bacterium]MDW8393507.1 outer membrane beta-barrel protein [Chitinophagales bacterium]
MKAIALAICTGMAISLLGLQHPCRAQASDALRLGIRGGVVLGINASQVDGDDYAGYTKVGLNAGFYGQIPISPRFFVSTEILYSQQGAKSRVRQGLPLEFLTRYDYAVVPVLLHFQEKEAINFGAGFAFARLINQQRFANQIEQPDASICSSRPDIGIIQPEYICLKRQNFMVTAEGNYLVTPQFQLNVRFAYSIVPMGYYGSSNFVNRGMYHNLLSFRVRYVFGGKPKT